MNDNRQFWRAESVTLAARGMGPARLGSPRVPRRGTGGRACIVPALIILLLSPGCATIGTWVRKVETKGDLQEAEPPREAHPDTLVVIEPRGAHVREVPGTASAILDTLPFGTRVAGLGDVDSWVEIELSDGGTGFVYGRLLGTREEADRARRRLDALSKATPEGEMAAHAGEGGQEEVKRVLDAGEDASAASADEVEPAGEPEPASESDSAPVANTNEGNESSSREKGAGEATATVESSPPSDEKDEWRVVAKAGKVMDAPSSLAEVVCRVTAGERVKVLNRVGDSVQVQVGKCSGYLPATFLRSLP